MSVYKITEGKREGERGRGIDRNKSMVSTANYVKMVGIMSDIIYCDQV